MKSLICPTIHLLTEEWMPVSAKDAMVAEELPLR
jgi:hypothetical protein